MRPDGHQALGAYYLVLRDFPRALTEDSTALALAPRDAELLSDVGRPNLQLGRWEAARGHLEQAVRLDPRSSPTAHISGTSYSRRAITPKLSVPSITRSSSCPRTWSCAVHGSWWRWPRATCPAPGQCSGQPPRRWIPPRSWPSWPDNDLMWVLDEDQQRLLLRLTPSAFDDDRANWGSAARPDLCAPGRHGEGAHIRRLGPAGLRAAASSGTTERSAPRFLGLDLAYLGQKAAAIREGKRGVSSFRSAATR